MFSGTSGHQHQYWPPRQSFSSELSPLAKLRLEMQKQGVGYYIVLTQDAHDSEYVAEADKRREFISQFTGSAGTAIIGEDFAELSTDGRYFLQAQKQLGPEWTLRKEAFDTPWIEALASKANASGKSIGVDPSLISNGLVESLQARLKYATLKPIKANLIDKIWSKKPHEATAPVFNLDIKVTGESYDSKIKRVRKALNDRGVAAICVSALDEIAWLFNLRGADVPFNPVFKAYAVITLSSVKLYGDLKKLQQVKHLFQGVSFLDYAQVWTDLESLAEKAVWAPSGSSWAIVTSSNATCQDVSPVKIFKTIKTAEEIRGAREAQLKCGLSFVRLFSWLERHIDTHPITEYDAAQKLLSIRNELPGFMGLSYGSISSVGPNAAIIHYEPEKETSLTIDRTQPYLLDAGCQFLHGTTDTTRTVHFGTPSAEVKRAYTLVLKGHIGLSRAVFPQGTNGATLDVLARQHLWQYGLNYRHGTGHGIGAFLNVHEPPVGFGGRGYDTPFKVGQLTSNEPGCYIDDKFGVRVESVLAVTKANTEYNFDGVEYLRFEYLTLVPLALNMIETDLLTVDERSWINSYSARVRAELSVHLGETDKNWLLENTREI